MTAVLPLALGCILVHVWSLGMLRSNL